MDRRELADFLRRRRAHRQPDWPVTGVRRTPGLRREEVARLAGISADYYMRLEQARGPQPSTQVLAPLARALRLGDDERDHLYLLAGHRPPAPTPAGAEIPAGLRLLMASLDVPAQLLTDLGDLLAQNAPAEALFGGVCPSNSNIVWRWFTDPGNRAAYPPEDHDHIGRVHVASLRAAAARRGRDPAVTGLIGRLTAASEEFARLWRDHDVALRREGRIRVVHPVAGLIDLRCERVLAPAADQSLYVFTPGSAVDRVGLGAQAEGAAVEHQR